MNYFNIIVLSVLVNNIVLSQCLGVKPLLGSSEKISTGLIMGLILLPVICLSDFFFFLLNEYFFTPYELHFLKTISVVFIVLVVSLPVLLIGRKMNSEFFKQPVFSLQEHITNTVIPGAILLAFQNEYSLGESLVFAGASAAGFILVSALFSAIRDQLGLSNVPAGVKGIPVLLITLGLLSMAFMGFSGMGR